MVEKDIKLSWQEGKGWKKSIGKYKGEDGQERYKMWYLGLDKSKAQVLAQYIILEWKQLKASGESLWTDEALRRVQNYKKSLYASPIPELTSKPKAKREAKVPPADATAFDSPIMSFHQAIDYYSQRIIPTLSIEQQWKRDLKQRMEALKDALGNLPLPGIGFDELTSIVNHYKNRPPNKNRKNRPISIDYASALIKTAKRLFEWLDDTERWEMPKRFDKIFRISRNNFRLTKTEKIKAVKGKPIFTVDELARLYQNVNDQVREWMTLSLNCGFTQSEIDSLLVGEVRLEESPPYIMRLRGKTQEVVGKWVLWDETAKILEERLFPKYRWEYKIDSDGLIYFRSINQEKWREHSSVGEESYQRLLKKVEEFENKPMKDTDYVFGSLIWFNDDGIKIDNVASAWFRLLRKTPSVRQFSFKSLRKTGADMIEKITGSEKMAAVYLSHKPKTVTGKHYTDPDFDRLAEALAKLRIQLEPMFDVVND